MIEKLDDVYAGIISKKDIILRINELVDAVNGILDYAPLEMAMKAEPADPYAEQRKWVGKLCRFWDGKNPKDYAYGTLIEIDEYGDFKCDTITWFEHCEPVKPDDDIIYKGE